MTTIRERAKAYQPPTTKNIADLDKVSVELNVEDEIHQDKDGKDFKISVFEYNGEKYRVPNTVIKQLKNQLEVNPESKYFKVKKEGTGLNTDYTVILLYETL